MEDKAESAGIELRGLASAPSRDKSGGAAARPLRFRAQVSPELNSRSPKCLSALSLPRSLIALLIQEEQSFRVSERMSDRKIGSSHPEPQHAI